MVIKRYYAKVLLKPVGITWSKLKFKGTSYSKIITKIDNSVVS